MLYRFLLADIEEELLSKLVSTSHIGLEWPIQEKKNPKTHIDLLYRLGLADTKETELKQGYRPARVCKEEVTDKVTACSSSQTSKHTKELSHEKEDPTFTPTHPHQKLRVQIQNSRWVMQTTHLTLHAPLVSEHKDDESDEFKSKRSGYTCIGMLYRFLLADIEDRKFAEACIGQTYRFGVADTIEKDPKTRIDLLYRLSLADTKETELKEDYRSAYRPSCIGLL
ncbi:unnamed protein product [Cochlearia groenlandica]